MGMQIIIMSATLPNLEVIAEEQNPFVAKFLSFPDFLMSNVYLCDSHFYIFVPESPNQKNTRFPLHEKKNRKKNEINRG